MNAEIIILLISFGFIILGTMLWQKGNDLSATGKIAEAIIFRNNFKQTRAGGIYYPVVRFLTEKQEWITQELTIGYLPAKPEGTKLEIIYDPQDPTRVEINSSLQLKVIPIVVVVIGVVGLIFGTLEYMDVIELIAS